MIEEGWREVDKFSMCFGSGIIGYVKGLNVRYEGKRRIKN